MSHAKGVRAERLVAQYLEQRGLHVLALNHRYRGGEIDLVVRDGDTLCFVEVRHRSSARYGTALETLRREKLRRIVRTAEHFLAVVWQGPRCACRFDVVTVDGEAPPRITWLRDAFTSSEVS